MQGSKRNTHNANEMKAALKISKKDESQNSLELLASICKPQIVIMAGDGVCMSTSLDAVKKSG